SFDVETDVLDGLDVRDHAREHATADGEVLAQVADLEQVVFVGCRAGCAYRLPSRAGHAWISDFRSSSFHRMQRTMCPLPVSSRAGMVALHCSCTKRQRGWKAQPSGR